MVFSLGLSEEMGAGAVLTQLADGFADAVELDIPAVVLQTFVIILGVAVHAVSVLISSVAEFTQFRLVLVHQVLAVAVMLLRGGGPVESILSQLVIAFFQTVTVGIQV